MPLMDLFKKKALDFTREVKSGVAVFSGLDPNSAFAGQTASHLAQAEVWAHGGPLSDKAGWFLLGQSKTKELATDVVSRIIDQEKVSSVLLDACNRSQTLIRTPKNATVVYGLGYGVGESKFLHRSVEELNPIKAWTEGIVVSEGDTAQIFTKSAIQAHLESKGIPVQGMVSKLTVKDAEGARETDVLGIFTNNEGKRSLTVAPNAANVGELDRFSLPIEQAPAITARFKGETPTFEIPGGRAFGSLEEASEALTTSLKAKARVASSTAGFLERAGIRSAEAEVTKDLATEVRQFAGKSYTGILTAGVLALGAAITVGGWKRVSQSLDGQDQPGNWDYKVPSTHQANLHGGTEAFSINRAQIQSPDGTTDVQLDDAQLEHAGIDQAFSKHLKYGFSHSSR